MSAIINETNFPNRDFRNYVSQYWDLDGDGILSDEEIAVVTSFYCRPDQYHSWSFDVKGLEFFTNLESIDTSGPDYSNVNFSAFTKLKSITMLNSRSSLSDVFDFRGCSSLISVNLTLGSINSIYFGASIVNASIGQYSAYASHNVNPSAIFDFTESVSIQEVTFAGLGTINDPYGETNEVSIIGLSNKSLLTTVTIRQCKCFLSLDCSNNVNLTDFSCTDCNIFRHLNISGCRKLKRFTCNNTDLRPSLDLREFPDLEYVDVTRTNLSSLLLGDKPILSVLRCFTTSDNIAISSLDLNGCPLIKNKFFVQQNRTVDNIFYQFFGYVENPPEQNPFNQIVVYDYRSNIIPISVSVVEGDEIPYASLVEPIWNHLSLYDESTMHTVDMFSKVEYSSNGKKYIFEDISEVHSADETWVEDPDNSGALILNPNIDWTSVILARSLPFELTVLQRPIISVQPQSVSVANGYEAVFSVTAIDPYGEELTYQWEKSIDGETWTTIQSNAASAVYSVPVSTADEGCRYRCIVSSPVASITSDSATVSVTLANFQWQVSDDNGSTWTDISQNGDSSSYSFVASKSDSGKQYRCIATNVAGSDISDPATLTVYDPPAIVSRSVIPECIAENSEVSLSVTASGDELHYRWEESANFGAWTPIDGATSSTYSFTASRADTGKRYRCYVYNDVGNVICDIYDDPANAENGPTAITVVYKPVVSPEESSSVVRTGNRASFSISAEGGRLTYKWQVSSDNGSTWSDIPNATTLSYSFTATKSDSGKQYRCQVTNIAGTTYSVAITLTVLDPPVINSELSIPDAGDGAEVLLQSNASGDELEYKWQISTNGADWTDIAENGTGETYSFTASVSQNHTYYRYQVFNRVGEETSNAAQLFVITRPSITSQPESQVVAIQSQVSFSVGTEGEHLSHNWQVSSDNGSTWTDIPNVTTLSYSFTATKSDSGKQYRCQVTNIAGTVESDPASLKVLYEPVIVTNPEFPNRVIAGDYVHCDADAHGDELQHQWYVKYAGIDQWYPIDTENSDIYTDQITYEHEPHQEDGEWIDGARFVRLAFYVTKEFFGNKYYCEFWNDVGRVSTPETNALYVLSEPTIKSVSAPDSAVRTGNPVSLSVVADGGDLSYQWQISVDNGASWQNVVDGGKASTYSFTATVSQNGYQYHCIVTNAVGSATCTPISLKVQAAPSISAGPVSQSVGLDTTVTFTAAISGTDLVYQWQVSSDNGATWIDLGDTDAPSYSLTASIEKDGHMYRCRASNDLGFVVTGSALLTVLSFPEIITQPSSATVEYASNVVFLVSATGGELAYQWEYSFDNGATWTKITKNGTNTTYSFLAVDSQNGYLYHCIVGNKLGTVTSEAASLTVLGSATTEEEIPVLVFAGKYLPSQMAAMIRELPIGANLDEIAFGARAVETLHASIGRTGSTDPRYYEEIAESINELKSLIAQLQSQNPSS